MNGVYSILDFFMWYTKKYTIIDSFGVSNSMGNGNKLRLLYIYQHLLRYADADHPVSTLELLWFLKEEHSGFLIHNHNRVCEQPVLAIQVQL